MTLDCIKDMKRIIALHALDSVDPASIQDFAATLQFAGIEDVAVFASKNIAKSDAVKPGMWIEFPDNADTAPKQKNFIIDWCKSRGFNGFLHIVEDTVKLNPAIKTYIEKLESTMKALDYSLHLSTVSDRCNYVFNKFCPRLSLDVDDEDIKQRLGLPSRICFTSHSNTTYMTIDFSAYEDISKAKLDERFTIGMFYIIELLARRRAQKADGQLYYMNQYLSIPDELDAYKIAYHAKPDADDSKKMKDENELFKSMQIDYSPDNNLDKVLEDIYAMLKKKLS